MTVTVTWIAKLFRSQAVLLHSPQSCYVLQRKVSDVHQAMLQLHKVAICVIFSGGLGVEPNDMLLADDSEKSFGNEHR